MVGAPLVESEASWNGMHRRFTLLAAHGIELPLYLGQTGRVRPDDLIDACAVAWTAGRIATGEARRLGDPETRRPDCAIYA